VIAQQKKWWVTWLFVGCYRQERKERKVSKAAFSSSQINTSVVI